MIIDIVYGAFRCTNAENCSNLVLFERQAPVAGGGTNANEIDATLEEEVVCAGCGTRHNVEVTGNISDFHGRLLPYGNLIAVGRRTLYPKPQHPESPYMVYLEAKEEMDLLLRSYEFAGPLTPFYRMALIQLFSNLEAYLCDTLIGQGTKNPYVRKCLLASVGELKSLKIGLAEVEENPEIVQQAIRDFAHNAPFHNFSKFDPIFKDVFGVGIIPASKDERSLLFKALNIRHDCVHRNGFEKTGARHSDLDKLIPQVSELFNRIVESIEGALHKLPEPPKSV